MQINVLIAGMFKSHFWQFCGALNFANFGNFETTKLPKRAILSRYHSKRDARGKPSDVVCDVLKHIVKVCRVQFLNSPPDPSLYAPAQTDHPLSFFP